MVKRAMRGREVGSIIPMLITVQPPTKMTEDWSIFVSGGWCTIAWWR
jgi:hypothetical protein